MAQGRLQTNAFETSLFIKKVIIIVFCRDYDINQISEGRASCPLNNSDTDINGKLTNMEIYGSNVLFAEN